MKEHINDLRIQNFKSIKDISLRPKRINLLIGKPNVGKSNILEALSVFQGPERHKGGKHLSRFIRFKHFRELLFDLDTSEFVMIRANNSMALLGTYKNSEIQFLGISEDKAKIAENYDRIRESFRTDSSIQRDLEELFTEDNFFEFSEHDQRINNTRAKYQSIIKKYDFEKKIEFSATSTSDLLLSSPNGENLPLILLQNKNLRKEVGEYFKDYSLNLVVNSDGNSLEVQKNVDGIVYKYPYELTADTLQRMLFHIAAIESNENNILLFEEPESHTYPPYIWELANKIVQSESNQFFIATHSPYLFDTILETTPLEELGLFITYFEDYQTKVKQVTDEKEIRQIMDVDIFMNLDNFIPA
jgi:AAA15 family ATPase/GTPase